MNDPTQDEKVLQQIEMEVRMREGAGKLLAACSQKDQALEASKSLLTCNTRILAFLSQLQQMRRAQILERVGSRASEDEDVAPCTGKIALSDLRIPLMWKDSEYFKNKGDLHRCAVFCLLQCGTEIHDTDLVMVDRTLTDVCFDNTIIFNDVGPGFQLRVELYSSSAVEDFTPGALVPRRLSFLGSSLGGSLGGSLGCSSGKKIRAAFDSAGACGSAPAGRHVRPGRVSLPLSLDQSALGPKYNLLAHTTLTIKHIQEGLKAHDLTFSASEDSPFWLPLYGSMCCRFVAQPHCMTQAVMRGQVKVKLNQDSSCWETFHATIRSQSLLCYQTQEDLDTEERPLLVIPDTCVYVSDDDPVHGQNVNIRAQLQGEDVTYTITTEIAEDIHLWSKALQQHIFNLGQWGPCCDLLMRIEPANSRRPNAMKQGSLYHEIVTPSSPRMGPVVHDLSHEIRTLLSSYYSESY
ncbi:rhotekin-like isoform X2 [Cololabis saira]|uniref:rhotekin-like isoform X2 n=1 Tax=Cololabis saira TaxID=129043 RepID=UPI002AD52881|nr:rhotekin-like isoform X2 [Cololabis saira]